MTRAEKIYTDVSNSESELGNFHLTFHLKDLSLLFFNWRMITGLNLKVMKLENCIITHLLYPTLYTK